MGIQVREGTIDEIEKRLAEMNTALNKIVYLESALKESGFSFEIKRFLWGKLVGLYVERVMFEKAAKAMSNKAGMEVVLRDKINSYLEAAELYSKVGKIDDADEMFVRAGRDGSDADKMKVRLARKNIYLVMVNDLEAKGKKASAAKFYERLIKMNLDDVEKNEIRDKLLVTYNALGLFREARLLKGL